MKQVIPKCKSSCIPGNVYVFSRNRAVLALIRERLAPWQPCRIRSCPNPSHIISARPEQASTVIIIDAAYEPYAPDRLILTLNVHAPESRKLFLGSVATENMCHLLSIGIHGFMPVGSIEHDLLQAVTMINKGHLYVSRHILERYVIRTQSQHTQPICERRLSKRQMQIIQLLDAGTTNKELSSMLGISENTIKFHLKRLFFKIGVHDRNSISALAKVLASSNSPADALMRQA